MHIILGLLGAIVSLLFILDRLGIDIGWLNPFSWARRRAWAEKYERRPDLCPGLHRHEHTQRKQQQGHYQ